MMSSNVVLMAGGARPDAPQAVSHPAGDAWLEGRQNIVIFFALIPRMLSTLLQWESY